MIGRGLDAAQTNDDCGAELSTKIRRTERKSLSFYNLSKSIEVLFLLFVSFFAAIGGLFFLPGFSAEFASARFVRYNVDKEASVEDNKLRKRANCLSLRNNRGINETETPK